MHVLWFSFLPTAENPGFHLFNRIVIQFLTKREKIKKTRGNLGFSPVHLFWHRYLVAGMGFEPHDLRVMSPTSYRTAPPRDILLQCLVPETGLEPVRDVTPTGF